MLRTILVNANIPFDPWVHRFFPAALMFFLIGAASHRFAMWLRNYYPETERRMMIAAWLSLAGAAAILVMGNSMQIGPNLKDFVLPTLFAACLPGLSKFQRLFPIDKALGEFSYPVYLWHLLVFQMLNMATKYTLTPFQLFLGSLALTMILSWFSNKYVDRNIQKIRQSFRSNDFTYIAPPNNTPEKIKR